MQGVIGAAVFGLSATCLELLMLSLCQALFRDAIPLAMEYILASVFLLTCFYVYRTLAIAGSLSCTCGGCCHLLASRRTKYKDYKLPMDFEGGTWSEESEEIC